MFGWNELNRFWDIEQKRSKILFFSAVGFWWCQEVNMTMTSSFFCQFVKILYHIIFLPSFIIKNERHGDVKKDNNKSDFQKMAKLFISQFSVRLIARITSNVQASVILEYVFS